MNRGARNTSEECNDLPAAPALPDNENSDSDNSNSDDDRNVNIADVLSSEDSDDEQNAVIPWGTTASNFSPRFRGYRELMIVQ